MTDVAELESFAVEHSNGIRLAYAQARHELGDDLIFLVNMKSEEGPILEAYARGVFLTSSMPDLLKDLVAELAEEGTFWVLVYGKDSDVSAMQMSVNLQTDKA